MAFRAIGGAVVLTALMTTGCGTVANLAHSRPENGGRVPFGGVKRDLTCLNQPADVGPGHGAQPGPGADSYARRGVTLLAAIDLPFSLVGDVVTWPYTAAFTFINSPVPTPPIVLLPTPIPPPGPVPTSAPDDGRPQAAPVEPLNMPRKLP